MLLLKLLARQYEAASAMALQCVCDRPLLAEEAQICSLLSETFGDQHPDAHAWRLRISLYALHTPLYPLLPWDLAEELVFYTRKSSHVQLLLRLAVPDELVLLGHLISSSGGGGGANSSRMPNVLQSRVTLLTAASQADAAELT